MPHDQWNQLNTDSQWWAAGDGKRHRQAERCAYTEAETWAAWEAEEAAPTESATQAKQGRQRRIRFDNRGNFCRWRRCACGVCRLKLFEQRGSSAHLKSIHIHHNNCKYE